MKHFFLQKKTLIFYFRIIKTPKYWIVWWWIEFNDSIQ